MQRIQLAFKAVEQKATSLERKQNTVKDTNDDEKKIGSALVWPSKLSGGAGNTLRD